MKKNLIIMLVISALMFTSLPLAVSASVETLEKTPAVIEPMGPFVGAGNDSYYRDNSVIFRGRWVPVSTVDLHIGADPEIPGGDQSAPAADEVDTPLTQPIVVITRAHSGKFIIGTVNPVIHGVKIVVRRIASTGSIIEILNCGNWTRQLGSDWTFSCPETNGPCRPGKEESKSSDELSPDGLTRTQITVTSDGCKTKIEKTITNTVVQEKRVEVCTPGAWLNVFEAGEANGKLGKAFKVSEVTVDLPADLQQAIANAVGSKDKINYLFVQRGACESEKDIITVRWFSKKGGWSWLSFGIGIAVGIGISFLIPHTRMINGIKTQVYPPVRTGISGSGNPIGGILNRPMRP